MWLALLLALTTLLVALPAFAAPTFPKLTGQVVDDANILSPATKQALTAKLQALETSTGRQLVVATVPSLQGLEIEEYGYQLGRAWGIGEKKTNDGAVLLIAPAERKVRVEVGYGLEPVLTDTLSSVIIQTAIIPKFRAGDMEGGVVAGADAIIQQLALPDDQAKAAVTKAAAKPQQAAGPPKFALLLLLFGFVFMIVSMMRVGRRGRRLNARDDRRRRHRGDDDDFGGGLAPLIIGGILGNMLGGGGGGGGGGWSGGGGFSGGGGSFGGGGASGDW